MNGSLYIIRHGKTAWNDLEKLQGRTDIPLNENGLDMARKAALEYRDIHFDICYCSPLIRARETARLLLEGRDVPVVYDDRLMEMSFGECEGVLNYFDDPNCPVNGFFVHPESYTEAPKGGETINDLLKRTGMFLDDVVYPELSAGRDVLIVGHGAMNSAIICQVRNLPLEDFWKAGIENCKLKKLI